MIDFHNAKRAGIGPADLARLLNVSRVTISLWFNGHNQPHVLHRDRVAKTLDVIGSAVDVGLLPLPVGTRRKDREASILNALAQARKTKSV